MTDMDLKEKIEEELDWEPSVDAADIGVAVEEGIVTLMGHVNTYAQKLAAERAIKRVKGVRAVAQELKVQLGPRDRTGDDEIARRAANVLDWDVSVPSDRVNIMVQDGMITLTGEVDWQYQANQARTRVYALPGVKGVSNQIRIKTRPAAADVKQRIERALLRNAEVEAKTIRVSVADGCVTLEGKVDAWHDRQVAEQAAWAAPGVKSVVDNIRIS